MLILPDMRTAGYRSTTIELDRRLELEHLPAYSPQLNPAERFFQELRRQLKNRVFDSYEEVEEAVSAAVKPYCQDPQRVKRLTGSPWLQNTPS